MEIKQLRVFAAIAECGSMSKASEILQISPAELAEELLDLENSVGVQLLINTPDRAILTEAGEKLGAGARKLLQKYGDLLNEISEFAETSNERLRIGSASAMFATGQLPEILDQLKQSFTDAEIQVSSGTSENLVRRILLGEIDVAFVSLPVESMDIRTDLLFSDEIVAIAHPNHPLAKEKFISAATLAGEKLILGEKGGNTRRMIDDLFEKANVKPNVMMELSRQESIVGMVEQNMGVGLAGVKNIAKNIREKTLKSWYIEGSEINWNLGLASLRGGYISPITRLFVNLCKESFAEKEKAFKVETTG